MNRRKVYPGQEVLSEDLLYTNVFSFTALGRLAQAMLGNGPVINGMAISPGGLLTVSVAAGEMYVQSAVDPTAYSSLPTDSTLITKQGVLAAAEVIATPAPAAAGKSINYLIQGQIQQTDTDTSVLPYYNAADPDVAWTGPNNDGTTNTTTRANLAAVQAKAGAAATTGSQVTPAPDAGWTGLYVITVANGLVAVAQDNIALYPGVRFISTRLHDAGAAADLALWAQQGA